MAPRRRLRALRVRLRRIFPSLRFGAFPFRLMLRAVEPITKLRSIRISSVGLRPTPRMLENHRKIAQHSGFGAAPQL